MSDHFRWNYSRHRLVGNAPVGRQLGKCERCHAGCTAKQWTHLNHPAAGDFQYWIICECKACGHLFGGTYTEAQAAKLGADTDDARGMLEYCQKFLWALNADALLPEDF